LDLDLDLDLDLESIPFNGECETTKINVGSAP
jgi:hypothetical protein